MGRRWWHSLLCRTQGSCPLPGCLPYTILKEVVSVVPLLCPGDRRPGTARLYVR